MTKQRKKKPSITARGTVRSFEAGNGFIRRENAADVFVNYEAIKGEDPRKLAVGDRVEVVVVDGPHGPRARSVRKV